MGRSNFIVREIMGAAAVWALVPRFELCSIVKGCRKNWGISAVTVIIRLKKNSKCETKKNDRYLPFNVVGFFLIFV